MKLDSLTRFTRVACACACALLADFASGFSPVPYFPLQVGNSWTYTLNGLGAYRRDVVRAEMVGGVLTHVMQFSEDGEQDFLSNDSGIRMHRAFFPSVYVDGCGYVSAELVASPPYQYVPADISVGQSGSGSGTVLATYTLCTSVSLNYAMSYSVVGFEPVTVPIGQFLALKVILNTTFTFSNGSIVLTESDTYWLVNGVGIVKNVESSNGSTETYALTATNIARAAPEAFSFTPVVGAAPGSTHTSNAITVVGTTVAAPISVSGGEYSVNGGAFTSAPGNVANGASVRVRLTAGIGGGASYAATLSIGGVSAAFNVAVSAPAVSLSPGAIEFPARSVGTTSSATPVSLSNTGNASLTLSAITAGGDFGQGNNCGASLAPGASCSINVTFTPGAAGARAGSLSIVSSAPGSPHQVALSGTGLATAALSLSKSALAFGTRAPFAPSAAQSLMLTNTGGAALTLSSLGVSGDFARTHDCGASLAAGASCTVSVTATPSASGARAGQLSIASSAPGSPHTVALAATGYGRHDTGADTRSDILWRHASGGYGLWQMNGPAATRMDVLPTPADANWTLAGVGDTDGDGKADLLWRHKTSGATAVWRMDGAALAAGALYYTVADANWEIAGVGDLDGDGKADLVWRHKTSGENAVWFLNGLTVAGSALLPAVSDLGWKIAGVADFDGDGEADLLWRHGPSGQIAVWRMNGASMADSAIVATLTDANWQIAGTGDFDGDGIADIAWRHAGTGQNALWLMNATALKQAGLLSTVADANWKLVGTGDYDGDGKADLLWRHAATGQNAIWFLNGLAMTNAAYIPAVADGGWSVVP